MLVKSLIVLASIIPSVVIGATVANKISERNGLVAVMQALVGGVIGIAAVEFIGLAPLVIVGTITASQTINVISGIIKWHNLRQRRKALNGDYGEITKWAAEITEDGNVEFAMAIKDLSETDKMEIAVIADSKEELHELVIERFDEMSDEQIPEDFA